MSNLEIKMVTQKFAKDAVDGMDKLFSSDPFSELEKIAKDIVEKQDNAKAMEFTKSIGTLLRENGITPILTEYRNETATENSYQCQCGYAFESLDFTEHNKVFEDEIAKLKNRIHELETELDSKGTGIEIPLTPIEMANYLINHTTHVDAVLFLPERDVATFDVSDLEQIAEYLLVYCKHNKEVEA